MTTGFTGPLRGTESLSWSDLLKKRVVVILGEAGTGKTFEFERQAARLQQDNKAAFFLALNELTSREAVDLALTEHRSRFTEWLGSDSPGYFFLDAVDESRLNSSTALQTALRLILDVLQSHLQRVSFFISSRVTDWSVPGVRETVERTLLKAIREAEASDVLAPGTAADTLEVEEGKAPPSIELDVFRLDPLSEEDAKRFAEAHGASPVEAFWGAVEDGGYEFMATRPLDLEWMAKRWASANTLGTYSELIEAALIQRLSETNQSYIDSGAVLSRDQLRQGAEQIAAACIFCGRPYVLINPGASTDNAVSPAEALPDWNPQEHLRLLGTAVFDEWTYGRAKFHHRAVREYLAACWVGRRLDEGLPVSRALKLFIQAPYGEPVLLNSRRSVLCWLASLNAEVRERVIRQFPEMLMFEGDPERWSADDVVEAFTGYIRRLESGHRPNWINDASELRRVARALPPGLLVDYLTQYSNSSEVISPLLLLVEYGRVMSCADAVFALYRDPGTSPRHRYVALRTLATVATPEQRAAIADDLVSGKLKTNELIGEAFKAVSLHSLTVEQITAVFQHTHPESEFGGGPMAMAIKFELLPTLDVTALQKLVASILCALPTLNIEELTHRAELERPKEAWMLSILPDCLLRTLQLMADERADAPGVLLDAALIVEKLRHTTYANDEDFRSLRAETDKHPRFRRRVALAIACSEDIRHAEGFDMGVGSRLLYAK